MSMKRSIIALLVTFACLLGPNSKASIHGSPTFSLNATGGIVGFNSTVFPFVNFLKMSQNLTALTGTTFIFPNNLNANLYPTGTLGGDISYRVDMPTTYLGQYVLAVTGTASGIGNQGIGFTGGFFGHVYSTTGSPTIAACTSPCQITNGMFTRGTNYTVTFDLSSPITGAANNGSGAVRLSATNFVLSNGNQITVSGVVGSDGNGCGANGEWTIANDTGTTIDLVGSSFTGGCTYTSGGQIFPYQRGTFVDPSLVFASGTVLSGVTSVVLCKLADYNADNTCNTTAGKTTWAGGFNDDFVQSVATLKPREIRYLDVNNAIFNGATDYANGPTTSWFTYNNVSANFVPARWLNTITGTNSYSATCSSPCTYTLTSGAPANGDFIQGYISNANTSMSPTLTVTDSASVTSSAVPIFDYNGWQVEGNITGSVTTGDRITLTYTSSCISGGSTTAGYTAQAGDNFDSIVIGLSAAISANSSLTSLPLAAGLQNPNGGNNPTGFFAWYLNYASNGCPTTISASASGAATEIISLGTMQLGGLATNSLYTFTYSSLLKSWLVSNGGTSAQWPWSLQVALANDVSTASHVATGCWLQVPLLWSNASFTSLANFAAANPCTGGTWFELSNEVWLFSNLETEQAGNIAASLGLNYSYEQYEMLRSRQLWAIAQTSFAGQLGNLHTVGSFQVGGVNLNSLNGVGLCGTSCSNPAYQNAIGADYNVGANQPHNFFTTLSEATYYNGQVFSGCYGCYGGYGAYGTWSASGASVASNVLTVPTAPTGTIYPNHGISSCDGAYIAAPTSTDWSSGQLTGKVTTTLNGAVAGNQTTWTLTSTAGLATGMWAYNAVNGAISGTISSINSGAQQVTLTTTGGSTYPSTGANDTIVFGGKAGTYQLNNTTCSASAGTITGGDILGFKYAADNFNGVSGALGSQQDAFNWMYQDAVSGTVNGNMFQTNTVSSYIAVYKPVNNIGGYGLPMQDYEGGFQPVAPASNSGQCGNLGLSNTYCDAGGFIDLMLTGFKNSSSMFSLEILKHTQQLAALPAGSLSMWFNFEGGPSQWALFPNNLYYPAPFKSYNAICNENGGSC